MVSQLFSRAALAAVALSFTPGTAAASAYALSDYYCSGNFAESFDFFNETDPTQGYVTYVNSATAQSKKLAGKTTTGAMYLGLDAAQGQAPESVRVTSKKAYNKHLVIGDIAHMPIAYGVWPAFWEVGPNWPNEGEIDILEGVNMATTNTMTLHTGPNCKMNNNPSAMSGKMTTNDCDTNSATQPGNAGCGVSTSNAASFGAGFNAAGGGVYAMEYSDAISIWFFGRSQIPADIASNSSNPDPSTWGLPVAKFSGCDLPSHFKDLNIVVNTAVCGQWAGKVWNQAAADGKSPATATGTATCEEYVAKNPGAFEQAFWEINSIRVYEPSAAPAAAVPAATAVVAAAPAAAKRDDGVFGEYDSTSDADYQQCQQLTPGFCKAKGQSKVHSAAARDGIRWTLMGLLTTATVLLTM